MKNLLVVIDPQGHPVGEANLYNEGNWWGRTQLPGFVSGIDSNAPVVVDSYPYFGTWGQTILFTM